LEIVWSSRKHHIGQRGAVCSRNNEGIEQVVRDLDKAVNSLSSLNGQANGEDQSEVRTIPKGLYQL